MKILKNKKNIVFISILLFIIFLYLASSILLPFIIGVLLAYVLNPLVIKFNNDEEIIECKYLDKHRAKNLLIY